MLPSLEVETMPLSNKHPLSTLPQDMQAEDCESKAAFEAAQNAGADDPVLAELWLQLFDDSNP